MDQKLFAEAYELLCNFQLAFDQQDWARLESCLDEQIYTDYSSFRGIAPADVSREHYVSLRKFALSKLRMQHNFSNLQVRLDAASDTVVAECNFAIFRFAEVDPAGSQDFFHSFGRYVFRLRYRSERMCISAITQHLTASQGNPDLHHGVSKKR